MAAASPEPFRLAVPDETLDDLRARLARTRWPDEIPGSEWRYGSCLAYLQALVERWRDGFDWRAQESELNAFDQYRVLLGEVDLHFVHQPGVGPDPAARPVCTSALRSSAPAMRSSIRRSSFSRWDGRPRTSGARHSAA
jgi:hypothetical protein